jgi:hypothetical protein
MGCGGDDLPPLPCPSRSPSGSPGRWSGPAVAPGEEPGGTGPVCRGEVRELGASKHTPTPTPPQMAPSGTKSANGKVFERRVARICMPLTVERNSMSHTHRCATWHTHRVPCGTPIAHRYELDQYITRAIWHKTCAIWQCHMARLGGAIWHTGIGRGPPPGRARREGISKGMAIGNPTVCPPRATWCTL